ncbi:MAG: sigma-70 family RNA polymerase sigma factor [Phycisphaerales bacterium]|nr:MAG: sigma-70 family RNA polymerase sigma factor [Phycisphaerales bacterium]
MNDTKADIGEELERTVCDRSSPGSSLKIMQSELGRLKRIAAGMGLRGADAEDVVQDVSIQALKHLAKCRTRQGAVRWLIKVTVNRCLSEHRRRRTFRKHARDILRQRSLAVANPSGAEQKVAGAEELEIVRQALRQLDARLLAPLVLTYFCDLGSQEVGRVLDMKASTVRSRLREGRMILARRLIERGIKR